MIYYVWKLINRAFIYTPKLVHPLPTHCRKQAFVRWHFFMSVYRQLFWGYLEFFKKKHLKKFNISSKYPKSGYPDFGDRISYPKIERIYPDIRISGYNHYSKVSQFISKPKYAILRLLLISFPGFLPKNIDIGIKNVECFSHDQFNSGRYYYSSVQ